MEATLEELLEHKDKDTRKRAQKIRMLMKAAEEAKEEKEQAETRVKTISQEVFPYLAALGLAKVSSAEFGQFRHVRDTRSSLKKENIVRWLIDDGIAPERVNEILEGASTSYEVDYVEFRRAR